MRPQRIHNLRGNKAERSPHRLVVWDTETRTETRGEGELHPLRIWCALALQRHGRRPTLPARQEFSGSGAAQLADALEASCRSTETTWCFAHNQSFDLAVTRLPLLLLDRGWTLTAHALQTDSPWARLARGRHRLVLADSTSWLPGSLAGIGDLVQLPKQELPQDADPDGDWYRRCRRDVEILAAALCELLDWWDRERLGSWSTTGPQTGFNAMRHRPSPHQVVIDPDQDARDFERRALYAGRREVWRLGRLPWGDYRELDFQSAHATVAAHLPLPKRRSVHFESMAADDSRISSERWAPMAWCTIRTYTPRYPVQLGGRLFYPVGTFRTLLPGPELREAQARAELLEVGPGYMYQLGQHMGDWGRWVLDELAQEHPRTPAVARTAIKAWSRNVPGKWAARAGRTIHEGTALEQGWMLEHGRHHPSGAPCSVLDLAGRRQVILQDQDADDCFPAVLAWVQSYVRVRLGRLVDAVGPEFMVSCNTDGLIYDASRLAAGDLSGTDLHPLRARGKRQWPWVEVVSPQHLVMPQERRMAGVPASAKEVGHLQYRWLTWPRLGSQIASGETGGYVRELRTVDLGKVPVNRWVTESGLCLPVELEVGEDGENLIVPPQTSSVDGSAVGWRAAQHPVLQPLLG